jgi:hypothetical protein
MSLLCELCIQSFGQLERNHRHCKHPIGTSPLTSRQAVLLRALVERARNRSTGSAYEQ